MKILEKVSSKVHLGVLVVFGSLVLLLGLSGMILNHANTSEEEKEFVIQILSERDSFSEEISYTSDLEYLGDFLREQDWVEWEDLEYGTYLKSFKGCTEDMGNQYWWCVLVDGESATSGVDQIPLEDNKVYTFELKHGW